MGTSLGQNTGFKVNLKYTQDVYSGSLWAFGDAARGGLGDNTTSSKSSPIQIGSLTNWSNIAAGQWGGAAIKTDGTLWTWGNNNHGQLGNGTINVYYSSPIQVGSLSTWSKVASGENTYLSIKTDGTLWAWGKNNYGQLGNGTNIYYSSPIQIGALTNWSSLHVTNADSETVAAIKTDGTLWTWGYGLSGQMGNNTSGIHYSSPIQVGSLTNWSQVSVCAGHTLAVKTDGTLWAWGNDDYGQLGNGTNISYSSPIQIGSLTNWSKISAGLFYSSAIKTDGTLWTWGRSQYGQLGNGTTISYSSPIQIGSLTNWSNICSSFRSNYAIKTDGTAWSWGYNNGELGDGTTVNYSSPIQIGSLSNWGTVSSNYSTTFLVPSSTQTVTYGQDTYAANTLWSFGRNTYGGIGNGTSIPYSSPVQVGSLSNWSKISAYAHALAIDSNGSLWSWGYNNTGQLGNGSITNTSTPSQLGSLTDWSIAEAGDGFSIAIKNNGTLWAWGVNSAGFLGNGTTISYSSPIQIGLLTNWSKVSAGRTHTLAVKTDGTLWAWGSNQYTTAGGGFLGNGTNSYYSSPIQIGSLTNWNYVHAYWGVSGAVKTDGTLWIWGIDRANMGIIGNGSTSDYDSPIQIGSDTNWSKIKFSNDAALALKTNGTLWAWGSGSSGFIGNGSTSSYSSPVQVGSLTTWTDIDCQSDQYAYALKNDGTLWAWGYNLYGQLGNGTTINYSSPIQIGALTNWGQVVAGEDTTYLIPSSTLVVDRQQDLGQRYVSKDYLLDVYPQIASATGARTSPGLWAWGQNGAGTLGIGNTTYYSSPIQVGSLTNWKQVSVGGSIVSPGGFFTLAVKTDGTLWAWGANYQYTNGFGQLGNGTTISYSSPIQIGSLTNWKQVSAAQNGAFSAAIKTDGTLWTWGNNADFQGINPVGNLGNGTTIPYSSPIQIGNLTNWKQVSCGSGGMTAIKTNGTLWSWGLGGNGQLGNGTTIDYSSPIQVGSLTNWKQVVSSRNSFSIALKTDGTLWAWGYNVQGNLGNNTTISYSSPIQIGSLTNWKNIAVGDSHGLATKTDGTLWGWGANGNGQLGYITYDYLQSGQILTPSQIGSLTNWATTDTDTDVVVYTGSQSRNAFYITSAGALYAWGGNGNGQLGNGTTISYSSPIQIGSLTNWKQVYNGFTVHAIKTDGTLWAWGEQNSGTLGINVSANLSYSSPVQVGSLTNWKSVVGGIYYASAIKTDGTLWAWGYNAYGMLGNNNRISYSSPVQVGALTNWKQVSATGYHTMAVKTDGTLWGWGQNQFYGSLGNNTTTDYSSPIQIGSLTNWKQVAAGQDFTVAVKTDGTLWGWGDSSSYGRLGNGTTLKYSSPIQIGSLTNWKYVSINSGNYGVFAIKTDGTLWAWGRNNRGQLGNGTITDYSSPIQVGSLTNWVQVFSAGERASIAAKSDGTLWSWGDGNNGLFAQQGFIAPNTSSPVQIGLMTNWKSVVGGGTVSYMTKTDGTLWACGYAKTGLGIGNTIRYSSPIQVGSLTNWKQISATSDNAVAIADGYY